MYRSWWGSFQLSKLDCGFAGVVCVVGLSWTRVMFVLVVTDVAFLHVAGLCRMLGVTAAVAVVAVGKVGVEKVIELSKEGWFPSSC